MIRESENNDLSQLLEEANDAYKIYYSRWNCFGDWNSRPSNRWFNMTTNVYGGVINLRPKCPSLESDAREKEISCGIQSVEM